MGTQLLDQPLEIASENGGRGAMETAAQPAFARRPKRWSNAEFEHIIEAGLLDGQRAELIDGEIIEISPMLEPHALALMKMQDQCYRIFSLADFGVRNQSPFFTGEGYRPEPDIAIVRRADLGATPPASAILLVEISDSTLRFDRTDKASLYASVGVEDYWIVNLPDQVLEVRRAPRADSTARFGFDYGSLQTLEIGASIAPLGAPNAAISVTDLLV